MNEYIDEYDGNTNDMLELVGHQIKNYLRMNIMDNVVRIKERSLPLIFRADNKATILTTFGKQSVACVSRTKPERFLYFTVPHYETLYTFFTL